MTNNVEKVREYIAMKYPNHDVTIPENVVGIANLMNGQFLFMTDEEMLVAQDYDGNVYVYNDETDTFNAYHSEDETDDVVDIYFVSEDE